MLVNLPHRYKDMPYRVYREDLLDKYKYSIISMTNGIRDFLWIRKDNLYATVIDQLIKNIQIKEVEYGRRKQISERIH